MKAVAKLASTLMLALTSMLAMAGPAEEAEAVLQAWSAAYSANEPEALVGKYWPDAVLLGTVSPVMSLGTDAIRTYFSRLKGSGNKNALGERRTIVLNDSGVVLTGFYIFTRVQDGKPVPGPSRFTMVMVRRADEWRIAHHHSSPHVQAPQ